jgi:hypothetical protein
LKPDPTPGGFSVKHSTRVQGEGDASRIVTIPVEMGDSIAGGYNITIASSTVIIILVQVA